MKYKETVSINIEDLGEYVKSTKEASPHAVTDWMALRSQLQVDGLKLLHDGLGKEPPPTIEQMRGEYANGLLKDLEMASKRKERSGGREPKFDPKFYDELRKPPGERLKEYQDFVKAYAGLAPSKHAVEAISAKALVDLDLPNMSVQTINAKLSKNLGTYKEEYTKQTLKDHNRATIGFKDKNGVNRNISVDELQNSKELGLTGEQRDFILTSWQQGSFESGWLSSITPRNIPSNRTISPTDSRDRTQLFIDASIEGRVTVHNRVVAKLVERFEPAPGEEERSPKVIDYVEGTTIVDVSNMRGDSFTPGCATSAPKIEIQLTQLDPDLDFSLPKALKTAEVPAHLAMAVKVKNLGIEANLHEIVNNTPKADRAMSSLGGVVGAEAAQELVLKKTGEIQNPFIRAHRIEDALQRIEKETEPGLQSHQRAVELYCLAEKDQGLQQKFAGKRLDKFLQEQPITVLNDEMANKMKEAVVSIFKPVCKDSSEKVILEKNAAKLIRECAEEAGKKMSWSQAWERLKEKLGDIGKTLFRKTNKAQEILKENPQLLKVIKEKLKLSTNLGPVAGKPKQDKSLGR